jgi:hypothetical protein
MCQEEQKLNADKELQKDIKEKLAANAEVRWKSDLVVLIMILLYYACLFP